MNRNQSRFARIAILVGALAIAVPALAVPQNPPAANKLQGYSGYELKPVELNSELAGKKNVDKVVAKVEAELRKNVGAVLSAWAPDSANAQKLVIEPRIESLHKPSGANRFFAGAAAGAWTFGAHDNAMLERVTQLLANYLSQNYAEPTSTETGFEP